MESHKPNIKILIPKVWYRFLPHILPSSGGLKETVIPVEDEGMELQLEDTVLKLIPLTPHNEGQRNSKCFSRMAI